MATAAQIEDCITDIKAGLCCPRVHGCEQNDGDYCLVRQAFARAGLIPDVDDEPCLSVGEQAAQAARCACRGADDYCPCQNAPDRETLAHRKADGALGRQGGQLRDDQTTSAPSAQGADQ